MDKMKQSGAVHMREQDLRKLLKKHGDVTEVKPLKPKKPKKDDRQKLHELELRVNKLWAKTLKIELFLKQLGYRGDEE